jgi:hypothetical protein
MRSLICVKSEHSIARVNESLIKFRQQLAMKKIINLTWSSEALHPIPACFAITDRAKRSSDDLGDLGGNIILCLFARDPLSILPADI